MLFHHFANHVPMKKPTAPRTPLLRMIQKAFSIAIKSNKEPDLSVSEIVEKEREHAITRRRFLSTTAKGALVTSVLGLSSLQSTCKKDKQPARIVIVGAGMAGLRAANRFVKAGHVVEIYEASDRTGGRMFSAKNIMGNGLTTELGGEFIDTNHDDMLELAKEHDLTLLDMQLDNQLTKDAFFFNGIHYTVTQVIEAFKDIAVPMQKDIDALYADFDKAAATLDYISIEEYLDKIGAKGWLKSLLVEAYVTEFGLNADVQSCVSLLYLISTDTSKGHFNIFGESDERFKILGGNQTLVDILAQKVSGAIQVGHKLEAVYKTGNTYKLNFQKGGISTKEVTADFVLMTLPFTMLREVKLDASLNFPAEKTRAINELGYGANAKLMMGFKGRPWRDNGYTGYLFTDNGIQTGWDNSQLQQSTDGSGGYTTYSGGTNAWEVGKGTPEEQAAIYLPKLEQIFPGAQKMHNGKVKRFHWPTYPYTKGSYACYTVGQWVNIAGQEFPPVGNFYFAGEHCSEDFQGYMNGSAETGRIAADEIMTKLK